MPRKADSDLSKRNRVATNVEDSIYTAISVLAEREGLTIAELARNMIITCLHKDGLLPETTLLKIAGVRA